MCIPLMTLISMAYSKTYTKKTVDSDGFMMPDSGSLEFQVLADLISWPDMIATVRSIVTRELFSTPGTQKAWTVLNEMLDEGRTIDLSTIGTRIDRETLLAIINHSPSTQMGTMDHCGALVEMSTRRLVWSRAYEMMCKAGDTGTDMSTLMMMPGDLVSELAGRSRVGAETQSVVDVLNSYEDELQDRTNGTVRKIPTGFPQLDFLIMGGWTNGNLIVMSARPSVGKSAVMLQMALSASRTGFPATVYSLEMPNGDLGQRLIWSTGHVKPRDIANDITVKHLDWTQVERANSEFDKLPLWFNTRLRTMDEICNDIVLQHQRGRCSIAFIDHLHIISGTDNSRSMYQAITERTRRFKSLAMDCGIPIVLLCQLNRMSETDNRPPDLMDLRDSGSIEQDADIVLMLDRHTKSKADPRLDVWVRKNRNGVAGRYIGLSGDFSRGFTVFTERDISLDEKV